MPIFVNLEFEQGISDCFKQGSPTFQNHVIINFDTIAQISIFFSRIRQAQSCHGAVENRTT